MEKIWIWKDWFYGKWLIMYLTQREKKLGVFHVFKIIVLNWVYWKTVLFYKFGIIEEKALLSRQRHNAVKLQNNSWYFYFGDLLDTLKILNLLIPVIIKLEIVIILLSTMVKVIFRHPGENSKFISTILWNLNCSHVYG